VAADATKGASLLEALSSYGLPLGVAFQLRDDLLGAFGDESLTGKPVGGDFREGKTTALVAHAFSVATSAQLEVLNKIGTSQLTQSDVASIQDVLLDTGAVAYIEKLISQQHDEAVESINKANINSSTRAALVDLALSVTQRSV
jgi:geranylgeranyl diphosphate synthase type I